MRNDGLKLVALTAGAMLVRLTLYGWIAIPFGGLAKAMCQYDCGWYARLAALGYGSNSFFANYGSLPNWVFFPLYPLLVRAASLVLQQPAEFAGILLSSALYAGFVLVAADYLRRTRPETDSYLWVLFAMLFPFSFTFSAVYTESLFTLLMLGAVLALVRRRILLAAVLTALMCATRPTGVLMLPVLAVDRAWFLWSNWNRSSRLEVLAQTLLPLAIAPLGLSIYMAVQYEVTGDALTFNHLQVLWGREWHGPLAYLIQGFAAADWEQVLKPKELFSQSYDSAWATLGLLVTTWLLVQRRWTEAWLLGASILLPLSSGLHSLPRFVATNPFFLFAAFDLASRVRGRMGTAAIYGTLGALHGAVLVGWFIAASSLY